MSDQTTIVLVRPFIRDYVNSMSASSFESSIGLVPPLNLCSIAAMLESVGIDVLIYDCEAPTSSESQFVEYLQRHKPKYVGISMITTNFHGALKTARLIRSTLPDSYIIGGGTHMMIYPEETFTYDEFNFGIIGEAEQSLADFILQHQAGDVDYSSIPGLVYRENGKVIKSAKWALIEDLDVIPFPAYHLLERDNYRMPNTGNNVITLYLTRGCLYMCGFCFRNDQLKNVRYKSIDKVIEEITYMVETFGARSINFVDEIMTFKKRYFLEFCEKLSAKNFDLEWQAPTRANCVDEEIIIAAKKSGCRTFRFGLESGSEDIMKKNEKHLSLATSENALRLCRKHGIKTVGYFIIGYLDETEETIRATIDFAKRMRPDYAAFFPATPMPETALYRESIEKGLVPGDYWRDFVLGKQKEAIPFIFPNAGEWTQRAYREFYFSPVFIFRQLLTWKFYAEFFQNVNIALKLWNMKFQRSYGVLH